MASHRKKNERYLQIKNDENVIEETSEIYKTIKGNWRSHFFKNTNPIVLELACGRGEYTIGLGEVFPEINYVGVDIKGERIAVGSKAANEKALKNVGFLRTKIQELETFFEPNEVDEIWITFPDPRPKGADARRRLTFPRFLDIYKNLLKPKGILHLKTDAIDLFEYSIETIPQNGFEILLSTNDLYNSEYNAAHYGIKTKYEKHFNDQGFKINYLKSIKKV